MQHTKQSRARCSRRTFVTGLAGGALASRLALADAVSHPALDVQRILTGREFDLEIGYRRVAFTGASRTATVTGGSLPGPILRWREGERVRLRVTNSLSADSSIHWHGLILPPGMDGVPGVSFPGIAPGETFEYAFDVRQAGTYWYHSHSGFQEQTGMYGPIVIDPAMPDGHVVDRDYVVMLSDWSDEAPERIFRRLKKDGHYYNFRQRTAMDLIGDLRMQGFGATARDRAMWNRMRMNDRDISDVTGYTYTYLMNGRTPAEGWTGLFSPGERVRLRFINAGAMTLFDVRIPGVAMTVIAADGQDIEPVTVDEFRIGAAETYDVIVEPTASAHTIFAQAIDRSGYAIGRLTTDAALPMVVPALDLPPVLGHADMGMAMDMDMDHGQGAHAGHAMGPAVRHAETEFGPLVDMRVEQPRNQLRDPGIGLRDNGRRVLVYADLKSRAPNADRREPGRDIELHLTGNMERYVWSINGVPADEAEPIRLTLGERVRIVLVNDTMMNHPIHLHGMWSDLETGHEGFLPRKHTVLVQPGSRVSYRVTADAPGSWAYHCHLLYHMMGMFRTVVVA